MNAATSLVGGLA